ncbi:DUF3696 domain-containing protein [Pseudomonas entomophila]|uniref:AAA family ATPase n=1 Tax=Pseudomonas entomophila TaxID=312306 RepID=UPI00240674FE|nr:DUF3696 domain-containing protein [Pseudomonas entomophila]MDF9617699.1 DUF3696 domain-containing protein [Pseudomonas entomophila]
MIETLKLSNLKSFIETEEIRLGPLTLFCGSNSSGKSSILQALLLLSQTLSARQTSNSVVLNGHLARLGAYDDIRSNYSDSSRTRIKLRLHNDSSRLINDAPEKIELDLEFGAKKKSKGDEEIFHPPIQSLRMRILNTPDDPALEEYIELRPAKVPVVQGVRIYSYDYEIVDLKSKDGEALEKEYPGHEVLGCKGPLLPRELLVRYNHTKKLSAYIVSAMCRKNIHLFARHSFGSSSPIELPPEIFREVNKRIDDERDALKSALLSSLTLIGLSISDQKKINKNQVRASIQEDFITANFKLTNKLFPQVFLEQKIKLGEWHEFLDSLEEAQQQSLIEFIDKHRAAIQEIWYDSVDVKEQRIEEYDLKLLSPASQQLRVEFPKNIKYLKPLRNEPSAVYPFMDQEVGTNIGLKGEYTAAVLHANKERLIKYPKPQLGENQEFSWSNKTASLQDACHDWLSYLGVVKKIQTIDKGKLGYELKVNISDKDHPQDLTHVGVGVSQILPILVMCLLADADNILILEQPELHLHPKVQSKLCDFFIAISGFNRQCLVETHSEYMINRLRLRIAQGNQERLGEESPIYFIEKNEGASSIRKVEINRFGVIQDWPDEFFDQSDREVENILVAAARKEFNERQNPGDKPKPKLKPIITRKRRDANSDQR